MITRLYADNFRCLSNFEAKFEPLTILLGPNGSGKSACLGLLAGLRDLILGRTTVAILFPDESRTRWDKRIEQTFEMSIRLKGGNYSYRLVVGHPSNPTNRRASLLTHIGEETLMLDGQFLYRANSKEIRIYDDNGGESPPVLPDWHVSGISRIHESFDNRKLIAFRDFFATLPIIALNPYAVNPATREKEPVELPSVDCGDFTDFLANLIVSDAQVMRPVEEALKEGTLPDLLAFEARPSGDSSIVTCLFKNQEGPSIRFRLDELSSGQIASVILQTMASFAEVHGGALILDEPGNFLAVSEMQPFLASLEKLALEHGRQVIISTHHPIAIDFLAAGHGLWFERDPSGPTRSPMPFRVPDDATSEDAYLRVSDLIARGWLSGIGIETREQTH
jgi:ABC-type Mn2+/Zn2+ transport system ATPase subunit